jgi:hypothetical protein
LFDWALGLACTSDARLTYYGVPAFVSGPIPKYFGRCYFDCH